MCNSSSSSVACLLLAAVEVEILKVRYVPSVGDLLTGLEWMVVYENCAQID
jgi:hypothetical protein